MRPGRNPFRGDAIMKAIGRYLLLGLQTDVSSVLGVLNKPPLKFSQLEFLLRNLFSEEFLSKWEACFPTSFLTATLRNPGGGVRCWVRGNGERFYLRDSNRESGLTNERRDCIQVLVLVSDTLWRGVKFLFLTPSFGPSRGALKE